MELWPWVGRPEERCPVSASLTPDGRGSPLEGRIDRRCWQPVEPVGPAVWARTEPTPTPWGHPAGPPLEQRRSTGCRAVGPEGAERFEQPAWAALEVQGVALMGRGPAMESLEGTQVGLGSKSPLKGRAKAQVQAVQQPAALR